MADPLHNSDIRDFGTRTSEPIGTGLESNPGQNMAYQAPLEDPILKGEIDPSRELPAAGNERLNRTAEQIGGALGKAVAQARTLPDSARRGLHVVRGRAQEMGSNVADQISGPASSMAETAQQRARELADSAQDKARDLAGTAQQRAQEIASAVQSRAADMMDVVEERGRVLLDRADDLIDRVDVRTRELRENARRRAEQVQLRGRRMVNEYPLQTLGGIAAASFTLGVILRIVRSRNASRY